MLDLTQHLATELSLKTTQVASALQLLSEGATVPFIARYRKERTGGLNEVQLRQLSERHQYLTELEERKAVIIRAIAEQGKLSPQLKAKIAECHQKTELEDLYLPYRPKRRTRASQAREQGLEPLAEWLQSLNTPQSQSVSLKVEAQRFICPQKGVNTVEAALKGACDILAEAIAEQAELRSHLRHHLMQSGCIVSRIKADYPVGSTKFEMYRDFQISLRAIAPHNLLALLRGQAEGILSFELSFNEAAILSELERHQIRTQVPAVRNLYQGVLKDAFSRLLKPAVVNAVLAEKKTWADEESIKTFETNLRQLLLAPPAGMQTTLAIDPGFRTGCKVAVIGATGKLLEHQTLYPHQAAAQRQQAAQHLKTLIECHGVQLIAIGNGTASRETDTFVTEVLRTLEQQPIKVTVNEAGASVYSASPGAIAEFPDLDVTVRGAISIGRRLQDPLAELVKIEPKAIGVGQYQHDVDQKRLKQKLAETVESCVNYVGVDLNTASAELLSSVVGLTSAVARNIVAYRDSHNSFQNRRELLKVPKLGPKAFEQAAGFLRIRDGNHPLDNTAVHPESYGVVEAIAQDLKIPLSQITQMAERLAVIDLKRYITDTVGMPTLRDIIQELEKPGRDPRAQFQYARFKEGVQSLSDLKVGMELEGVVTNVVNFGVFVDVGVHQDGLVHISQLANRYVSDPQEIARVGQVVTVRVLEVNERLNRIGLTMRLT